MTTKSNKKAVKAGMGYVIGNYMLKGITFLSAPIFSRLLKPADYGIVNIYSSYEAIFYIILGLALHASINNAKYKYGEKLDEYISSLVFMVIISTTFWTVLGNLFFESFQERFGFGRGILNVLILHCMASALLQMYNLYVGLNYQYKDFLKISATNALLNIAVSVAFILIFFNGDRANGRIVGMALPMIGLGVYFILFFFSKAKPKLKKEYVKYAISYSLPVVPHGISQVILSSFDRIMIKDMVSEEKAGIYSFAYTLNQILLVLVNSIQNVWKPWMFEKMKEKAYEEIREKATSYVWGISLVSVLLLLVSPEAIKILGPRDYWDSVDCVVPVLIGGFFSFLYLIPSLIEYYYEKTKFIAIGSVTAAGINVLLNYLFIPKYGYIAAAYTTLITYFLYFLFHYGMARVIHKNTLFDTAKIFGICFEVMIVGGFVLFMKDNWMIRWLFAVGFGIWGLFWANKQFGLAKMLREKVENRKEYH